MKKSDLKIKTASIKELAQKSNLNLKPKMKTGIRLSNDSLSKSIRNKKDAQTFINELKTTLKNNS